MYPKDRRESHTLSFDQVLVLQLTKSGFSSSMGILVRSHEGISRVSATAFVRIPILVSRSSSLTRHPKKSISNVS